MHKTSDLLTHEAFHQLELYQEIYRLMGVEYQIAATIKLEPDHVTALALSRQTSDYTERAHAILEMLRPHLVIAFNNLTLARESQAILDTSTLALKELSSATIIVNQQGRALYHTGPGWQWLGGSDSRVLPAKISDWLSQSVASTYRPDLNLVSETHRIRVRAVPTSHKERLLLALTKGENSPPAATATDDFGLSKRESEVGRWICTGKTNSEIGAILGITPRTVDKHVEHILQKLGVETRLAVAVRLRV